MSKFKELLTSFLHHRDTVSNLHLGLHHIDKDPDMIAFQKAAHELYKYVEELEKK